MREVFLDTETTGLLTREDHRVLEIACIETENLIPTKNSFYKLINPEREVTEDAFKVHGISSERLLKEKKFAEIADELIEFIANKKLIIHNASFDIGFLNHEFKYPNIVKWQDITVTFVDAVDPNTGSRFYSLLKNIHLL